MESSCAVRGVCDQQEARSGARDAGNAQRRRAHEPTRPRPDNTRRAGDDARPGAAPAPHSPGRQALESALPRAAPPTDLAGNGVSTRPRALPPQAPNGGPGGDAGRPCPAAKGKDRAGPHTPGLVPNQAGGAPGLHPHISCRMQRREAHARARPFIQAGPPVGGRPPKSLRDFGSNGTLPQEAGCSPVPFPQLRLAAPGASVGPSYALPSSWPPLSPQTLGRTNSDPLDDPELPLAGEVDFRGELGGRFPVRSFNLISPFPSKSIPSPFPEKAGTRWCDSKEWLVEVENDGGTQSPNLV